MNSRLVFFITIFIVSFLAFGCGDSAPSANNAQGANTSKSNNPLAVSTPTPEQTTNNAPTLTPVFKAYCQAMIKKDEAAIRRIYSKDTIADFESKMKEDGIKNLLKYLENDVVTDKLCEVRNEQIKGDIAEAEIRTESYPNGIRIEFVRENGEWKLTNKAPTLDSVKQSENK